METEYQIEKQIWSESDFPTRDWHDNRIYSVAFIQEEEEFRLDIDYIFKWVEPPRGENYFSFWVSPATLCFQKVSDVNLNINIGDGGWYELQIVEIRKILPEEPPDRHTDSWLYEIELTNGSIMVKCAGYKMYVRKPPVHTNSSILSLAERQGISLDKIS